MNCPISRNFRVLFQTNDHCHDGVGGHDRDQTVPKTDAHLYDDDGNHRSNYPNKDNGGYRGDGDVPDVSNDQDTDHKRLHEFPNRQKSTDGAD